MAEESKLTVERLSALLGISDPDETVKVHLEFALENAEDTVKNYCHIDEIPVGLETTVLRMAMDIYRNEHMGSADIPQTVSSVQIGDTTTSFKTSAAEFSESLMKNYKPVLNRYRKMAIEAMYEDTCTVVEHRKTKEKGVVTYTDTVVLEYQPCKLSFETIAQAEKTDAASPVAQAVKLFVAPEVEIKSGSKIIVTHCGNSTEYTRSGVPGMHPTHQEIMLDLFKEWA